VTGLGSADGATHAIAMAIVPHKMKTLLMVRTCAKDRPMPDCFGRLHRAHGVLREAEAFPGCREFFANHQRTHRRRKLRRPSLVSEWGPRQSRHRGRAFVGVVHARLGGSEPVA
jgi:hypothetical protein